MSKRIIALFFVILLLFYFVNSFTSISAVSSEKNYLIRGFSYGFYKILNDFQATCTSITSQGEKSVIFCKSGYEISKAVTSKSYLYILAKSDEYHAIFTLLRNGNTDTSYIPSEDVNPLSFTASDKSLHFISKDKSYTISVNRNTHDCTTNFFTDSVNKLFVYDEKVYAVTSGAIYSLDNPTATIKCDIPSFDSSEPVFYENIFIDTNGKVYFFSSDNGFKYIKTLSYKKAFMLNNTYYGVNESTIYKLSENGSAISKYSCSENIDDIAVNGNKIALLNSKNVRLITQKDFTAIENPKTESSSPISEPDFDGFTDYTTDRDYIIIPQGTTVAVLKKHINSVENSSLVFYNDDSKRTDEGTLGTGFSLYCYENSSLKAKYTIIVMGDVTGEGSVNTRDKRKLTDYLLGKLELTSPQKYAANLDKNNTVDSLDLLLLIRIIS